MAKISPALRKIIEEIQEFADSNFYNKLYACKELLCKKIFHNGSIKKGIDVAVIPEILPVIMKFLESENQVFQQEGALMITAIICTPNTKYHAKLVIDADVITKLVKLLTSRDPYVLDQSLNCICNISEHFPDAVIQNEELLLSLNKCLSSEKDIVTFQTARLLEILLSHCEENIFAMMRAGCLKPLIGLLESKNDDTCIKALNCLIRVTLCNAEIYGRVFDNVAIKSMEIIWNRFTDIKTGKGKKLKAREEIVIKLLIVLENLISNADGAQVDMIIKNLVPKIFYHIYGAVTTHQIKIKCIKLIKDVITFKPQFVPFLIDENDLINILCKCLQCAYGVLLETVLSALKEIIDICDDKEWCRQKFKERGSFGKLINLRRHGIENIVELSSFIFDFINTRSFKNHVVDSSLNVMEIDAEAAQTHPQLRRPASEQAVDRSRSRSKRSRTAIVQIDQRSSDAFDSYYDDFDEHPTNYSPVMSTTPAATVKRARNETKHSITASPPPPIVLTIPDEIIAAPNFPQNRLNFEPLKYWRPHESYIHEYCELLGAKFNRNDYDAFIVKIKFSQITSTSKPALVLPTNEKSGFGCLSICLTGNEESTKAIRKKINQRFVFNQTDNFDEEKITEVIGQPFMLKDEHLETIAAWFKCRIMIFCSNRYWKRFGDWEAADDRSIPVFVFEKKKVCGATAYRIVLSLKDN